MSTLIPNPKQLTLRRSGQASSKASRAGGGAAAYVPRAHALGNILSSMVHGPLPVRYSGRMTYAETYTLSSGAAAGNQCGTEQVMNLNSLYDPNDSGAGHQPYGFDQLSALYKRYKVNTAIVDVLFTTPGGDHDMQCCVLIQGPGGGQTLTGMYGFVAKELPNVATRHLSTTGSRTARFQARIPIWSLMGITKAQFDANTEEYAAYYSASPARLVTMSLGVNCYDNTTSQTSVVLCTISYEFDMWDRTGQSAS